MRRRKNVLINFNMFLWLKNIARTCYGCGKSFQSTEGRCSPMCSRCNRNLIVGFK